MKPEPADFRKQGRPGIELLPVKTQVPQPDQPAIFWRERFDVPRQFLKPLGGTGMSCRHLRTKVQILLPSLATPRGNGMNAIHNRLSGGDTHCTCLMRTPPAKASMLCAVYCTVIAGD